MRIAMATAAGDSGMNEDWAGTLPGAAVVLDGVSAPVETGCRHGTRWYVAQLGSRLLAHLATEGQPLRDVLAAAISETSLVHASTCDLSHPGTPAAAVAIVRFAQGVEYLVLADTAVVIDQGGRVLPVVDHRVDTVAAEARAETMRHPVGSAAHAQAVAQLSRTQRQVRNQPGGYWVAASNPAAAAEAIVGTVPLTDVDMVAVLTDGATGVVDRELASWRQLLDVLVSEGPHGLIAWNRRVDQSDPDGQRWPRYKRSDDATAVMIRLAECVSGAREDVT